MTSTSTPMSGMIRWIRRIRPEKQIARYVQPLFLTLLRQQRPLTQRRLSAAGATRAAGPAAAAVTAANGAQAATTEVQAARAAQLAKNVAQGVKAETKTVAKLGDKVAAQRVTLESSTTGRRSVTDIVSTDKAVTEVKSGNAKLSQGQKDVKADIDAGRAVIPRGANAEKAGLEPGKPTTMKCYTVERCQ